MELNYKEYGAGEPLIILHGLLGTLDNWHTLSRKFSEAYHVYALDQRNHGRSPHTEEMSYALMAGDLNEFMEQKRISTANVIGHSMGGKTAMQFALDHPDKVDKLIVADMGPFRYFNGHREIFEALRSVDLSKVSRRRDAGEQLKALIEDSGIRQFLLKNLERTGNGKYIWKMNLPVIEREYTHLMEPVHGDRSFSGPVLFIKAGNTDYILEKELDSYKTIFPGARLEVMKNTGHWVHAEAPQRFLEIAGSFLKTNDVK